MAIVVLYIGSLGSARAFSPQPGTQDDPLITVSYLTQVVQPLLTRISALEKQIAEMQGIVPITPSTPTTPTNPIPPTTPATPTTPTPPVIVYGYINGTMVNIRSGAGTNFSIIATLPMNTRLELLERGKDWHKVKYQDRIAFVSATFFRIP
ncbi:MAG: SH3 domain-containing protein [Bacillota bacterium]|nr:SH3 domain-containing protein [Bacillota bacterium]